MNSKSYRWCSVPLCTNTSIKTPDKLFVFVPYKKTIRVKWLRLSRRDLTGILPTTQLYFSKDHFDYPQFFNNQPADEAKLKKVEESLEILNTFLEGNQWVAGSTVTVADISILSSISNFPGMDIDIFKYPNIKAWFQRAKSSVAGFNLCEETIKTVKQRIQEFKAKYEAMSR